MAQVKIDEISYNKLLGYARALQLDVKRGETSPDELRKMVRAANGGGDMIEIVGDAEEVPAANSNGLKHPDPAHHHNDPLVTVNIASDEMNGGSHPFPVSCNGVLYLLKRDTDVQIPYRHYQILNSAIEKDFEHYVDPNTGMMKERVFERQAIRFTVKNLPTEDEIAAFHERTRNIRSGTQRQAA